MTAIKPVPGVSSSHNSGNSANSESPESFSIFKRIRECWNSFLSFFNKDQTSFSDNYAARMPDFDSSNGHGYRIPGFIRSYFFPPTSGTFE